MYTFFPERTQSHQLFSFDQALRKMRSFKALTEELVEMYELLDKKEHHFTANTQDLEALWAVLHNEIFGNKQALIDCFHEEVRRVYRLTL